MEHWKENDLNALASLADEQAFFDYCAAEVRRMDFDCCSYGMALPLPVTRQKIVIYNNYPVPWWDRYVQENYAHVDPTIRHAVTSTAPIVWSDQSFASAPALWDDVRAHGLQVGWGQPTRDRSGTIGMLTLSRAADAIGRDELVAKSARMLYMAQLLMVGMTGLVLTKLLPESRARLTPREVEVMRWTADGKTTYEISRILVLSISAVNFHINNAVVKLDATNKTQAVVKAAMLGLLS